MALAAIVSNLDDVPESLREHYQERGGKWHLDTEGDEAKVRLNRDLAAERKRRQELEDRLKGFGDLKPEDVEGLRQRRRREDDDDETASARMQRLRAELEETKRAAELSVRERDQEMARIKSELSQERIGARIRTTAQSKLVTSALDDAVFYGMRVFREDADGKFAAFDANGERLLGKSGEDLSLDEWLEDRRKDRPHWFSTSGTGNQGGGAGHQGSGTAQSRARPRQRSQMTAEEKAAAIGELGIEAFMQIPQ